MNALPLILFGVLLNASAQLLLKEGMNRIGHFVFSTSNIIPIGLKAFSSPFVLLGFACYTLSVIVWMLVLSRVDVSYAYPLVSIGYIVTAIAAVLFLNETLPLIRIAGILVIIFGVYLVTRS